MQMRIKLTCVLVIDRTRVARAPFEVRAAVYVQVSGYGPVLGKLRYAVCACIYNNATATARAPSFGPARDGRVVWLGHTTAVVEQFIG